jgi:hypothetical protein
MITISVYHPELTYHKDGFFKQKWPYIKDTDCLRCPESNDDNFGNSNCVIYVTNEGIIQFDASNMTYQCLFYGQIMKGEFDDNKDIKSIVESLIIKMQAIRVKKFNKLPEFDSWTNESSYAGISYQKDLGDSSISVDIIDPDELFSYGNTELTVTVEKGSKKTVRKLNIKSISELPKIIKMADSMFAKM